MERGPRRGESRVVMGTGGREGSKGRGRGGAVGVGLGGDTTWMGVLICAETFIYIYRLPIHQDRQFGHNYNSHR